MQSLFQVLMLVLSIFARRTRSSSSDGRFQALESAMTPVIFVTGKRSGFVSHADESGSSCRRSAPESGRAFLDFAEEEGWRRISDAAGKRPERRINSFQRAW